MIEYNSTGPRTNFGVCRPFQDFTWTHLPTDFSTGWNYTDVDGLCVDFPNVALLEDKMNNATCEKGQLMSLQALDLLITAGAKATGGRVVFASCGTSYDVTLNYTGLVFRTDTGIDGRTIRYDGDRNAVYTVQHGTCYGLDGLIRNRAGNLMLLIRETEHSPVECSRSAICKAIHKLVLAGMKATGGKVHPKCAKYPLRLKYNGLHTFRHEDCEDIAAGRMWWDGVPYDLTGIQRAFTFGDPGTPSPPPPLRPVETLNTLDGICNTYLQ
jgi:hypothetical protein